METAFANRIVVNPRVLGGKPVIKGTRIPLYIVLQMLRDGSSFDDIIREYPRVSLADIRAVLDYAMYKIDPDVDEEIRLDGE